MNKVFYISKTLKVIFFLICFKNSNYAQCICKNIDKNTIEFVESYLKINYPLYVFSDSLNKTVIAEDIKDMFYVKSIEKIKNKSGKIKLFLIGYSQSHQAGLIMYSLYDKHIKITKYFVIGNGLKEDNYNELFKFFLQNKKFSNKTKKICYETFISNSYYIKINEPAIDN